MRWWKWVCELCYRQSNRHKLPGAWLWTHQSAICPDCQHRAAKMGKDIPNLRGGCFSDGRIDPRDRIYTDFTR